MALSNPFNPPPNTPLLPDPTRDSVWRRWLEQLWRRIQTGALGGTVTSVAVTVPTEFSVSGSPITSSGTIAITKATETANTVWAGPTTGAAAQPAFRALVAADLPAGTGTVTSVGLSLPTSVFDVSGSPVTTSGTLTATFDTQSANTAFMGPTTGSAATPAFRALVAADIAGLTSAALKIIYDNENLDIPTNTQILGFVNLVFTGTGNLIIAGTGQLRIL